MNPELCLNQGVSILNPFMNEYGFEYSIGESGKSSGGNYSWGKYVKENRFLELHYRYSLGLVKYHIGDKSIFHEDYMRMLGVYGKNHYPGFSENPFQAFEDLLFDLKTFSKDFISGTGKEFEELVIKFNNDPNHFKGFKALNKMD